MCTCQKLDRLFWLFTWSIYFKVIKGSIWYITLKRLIYRLKTGMRCLVPVLLAPAQPKNFPARSRFFWLWLIYLTFNQPSPVRDGWSLSVNQNRNNIQYLLPPLKVATIYRIFTRKIHFNVSKSLWSLGSVPLQFCAIQLSITHSICII